MVRTAFRNGRRGYIHQDNQYLNDGNTLSFGQDTATIFYQPEPYFTGDKLKILTAKITEFNRLNALFFTTTLMKSFHSFQWGSDSFSMEIIRNQEIKLPVNDDHEIDTKLMDILIVAVQKIVIKDVVKWTKKKIATTKTLIKNTN